MTLIGISFVKEIVYDKALYDGIGFLVHVCTGMISISMVEYMFAFKSKVKCVCRNKAKNYLLWTTRTLINKFGPASAIRMHQHAIDTP